MILIINGNIAFLISFLFEKFYLSSLYNLSLNTYRQAGYYMDLIDERE